MNKITRHAAIAATVLFLFSAAGCSVQLGNSSLKEQQNIKGTQQKSGGKGEKEQVKPKNTPAIETNTPQDKAGKGADASTENTLYISASQLNVRENPDKSAKKIDVLMKGAAVRFLEEKSSDDKTTWNKIAYEDGKKEKIGWILASYTVTDRTALLSDSLKQLDYFPQKKIQGDYPGNPRVTAKGIYLTIYSAAGQRIDKLIEMTKRTEINTFVIDVKDDRGHMLFPTKAAEQYAPEANKKATVKDIKALIEKLRKNNIYAVARIVSFKDPTYSAAHPDRAIIYKKTGKPFTNSDKLIWATAYDRELWSYDVAVAKEAAQAGFNEIQFDYVRFPASNGGKLDKELDYRNTRNESKPKAIQEYLKYAHKELSPLNVYISADIYGLVSSVADDMALGQYWEAVSNVVDYVSPMMYPSHYANKTYGLPVPDAYPYETVFHSAKDAVARNQNIQTPGMIRPWIQDFTASWVPGHISYGEKEVRAQIKALKENGIDQYLLWNANNRYTESAVKK